MTQNYCKRLIEVDLPIREISRQSRREKSIRHGHISTLHTWWARRPLAACRAVLCASLWPDPADERCPNSFRHTVAQTLSSWIPANLRKLSADSYKLLAPAAANGTSLADPDFQRRALLAFIADFSDWDKASDDAFIDFARTLSSASHATRGTSSERPIVLDPFAGGGAIPVEALRVGAEVLACDLNPVAVLLNRTLLEFVPRHGEKLIAEFQSAAARVQKHAETVMSAFYGDERDRPLVYVWARTVRCEGPGCGRVLPLLRSTILTSRSPRYHIEFVTTPTAVETRVATGPGAQAGSVKSGAATCPACGYTTSATRVKAQLIGRHGGADDAMLVAIMVENGGIRTFREPTSRDLELVRVAREQSISSRYSAAAASLRSKISRLRPYKNTVGVSIVGSIGIERFRDLFTTRQFLAVAELQQLAIEAVSNVAADCAEAVRTLLLLAVDRVMIANTSVSRWDSSRATVKGAFSKQALQVIWDFAELNPAAGGSGSWTSAVDYISNVLSAHARFPGPATVLQSDAKQLPFPDDSVDVLFTDPPYFAAIPYADLSDIFYVWLRAALASSNPSFAPELVNREEELIVTNAQTGAHGEKKDAGYFRREMTVALARSREIVVPDGIGCVVFAESATESWEAMLSAMIDAGWIVTACWPIDTEMQNRTVAAKSATLQSSVHIVCRPREDAHGRLNDHDVGNWRDVLSELPMRIAEWMPRLAREGVVGADAIFACLGPALEVFSKYARVEKANGDVVALSEYLEHVWAAVARQALAMVWDSAETSGLEADSRLTAIWLWTLGGGTSAPAKEEDNSDDDGEAEDGPSTRTLATGFELEYDAARKLAQGLGARLEELNSLIEVSGDTARLLPVTERVGYLFAKGRDESLGTTRKKKQQVQSSLFAEIAALDDDSTLPFGAAEPATTTLDRIHQSMLLFGAGRGEALKRFLIEEGVGSQPQFWKVAQSLSALYPSGTDEKRWIDGVLARKKSFGFA